jgi:hypothetical protein
MEDKVTNLAIKDTELSAQLRGGRGSVTDRVVREIKYALIDANTRAIQEKTSYSVVFIDTLETVLVVESKLSGEEYGWNHIATVTP